jgi:hypothetical protein
VIADVLSGTLAASVRVTLRRWRSGLGSRLEVHQGDNGAQALGDSAGVRLRSARRHPDEQKARQGAVERRAGRAGGRWCLGTRHAEGGPANPERRLNGQLRGIGATNAWAKPQGTSGAECGAARGRGRDRDGRQMAVTKGKPRAATWARVGSSRGSSMEGRGKIGCQAMWIARGASRGS